MAVHPDTMLLVAEGRRLETMAEVGRARLADAVAPGPRPAFDRERMRFLLRALWPPAPPATVAPRPPADPEDGSRLAAPTA